ncbi:MAG: pyruvate, phosphate dikinase [Candidatus Schekmanbacteria bacterium]|nr:pyruvate, phosphate dikinase [Candidatus Schekmanbacteria bacterium]
MGPTKYVYFFGGGEAEGRGDQKELLGGKGAGLAEMTRLGIPVPPGFTISTEACLEYYERDHAWAEGLAEQVIEGVRRVEALMDASFGDEERPLLFSVRSGARASMPGMMDTVLNIGLNDRTVQGLVARTGNRRFAFDAYRRLVTMYGDVVLEVPHDHFEAEINSLKSRRKVRSDTELSDEDLERLVRIFKRTVVQVTGRPFPEDPHEQLRKAVNAVFESWHNKRAIEYRRLQSLPDNWGTAVNVQAMVFGNLGETSGSGVAFTRNPATGDNHLYGEYLPNAQGEDVVAGTRDPMSIDSLNDRHPALYKQLQEIRGKLEGHYRDMQDVEFTVQDGKLFMLQTRSGKRTGAAAVRIAMDMVREGKIDVETALLRVDPKQLEQLLHPMIDPKVVYQADAKGLPASPGAAVGKVVFTAEDAKEMAEKGEKVILVRPETSPEDIGGMHAAEGILTCRGGMTSHAAVVARGMGKPCVAGVANVVVNLESGELSVGDRKILRGQVISLNGTTGEIVLRELPLVDPEQAGAFGQFMDWADERRRLRVRANADTPEDARRARKLGAEGIGLCRTEHMFFGADRLPHMRAVILARTEAERRRGLERLLPMQREDFIDIFRAMDGFPVTIRLLDPPLHEFLPKQEELIHKIAEVQFAITKAASLSEIDKLAGELNCWRDLLARVESLHELNPMLGHRGCRLGISFPEIYDMQARAIFEAARKVADRGVVVIPEIMIPLVGDVRELEFVEKRVRAIAEAVLVDDAIAFKVGTMIEVPRAALTADEIGAVAEFFSFGTNDLTQMTFGFSRDDAGPFLAAYEQRGVMKSDPFQSIDERGVGQLMKMAISKGRSAKPNLKIGICGEHGGDPQSVAFCHHAGTDYVSCSPFRVPIARLAAAQAVIRERKS